MTEDYSQTFDELVTEYIKNLKKLQKAHKDVMWLTDLLADLKLEMAKKLP